MCRFETKLQGSALMGGPDPLGSRDHQMMDGCPPEGRGGGGAEGPPPPSCSKNAKFLTFHHEYFLFFTNNGHKIF